MPLRFLKSLRSLQCSARTLGTATAVLLFAATCAHAQGTQKVNAFAKFGGNWSGSGKIFFSNGKQENIRCRGGFVPTDAFNVVTLKLQLRCANDSITFELQSEMNYDGGQITGVWTEKSRGINGQVSGKFKDEQIEAIVESQTFTANLDLINLGDKQQVRITSPGSEMTDVLIGLNRLK